jgi:hypothetical protein
MISKDMMRWLLFSFSSIFLGLVPILPVVEAASMIEINDDDVGTSVNQFQYSGSWQYGSQVGAYNDDNHWSESSNSSYQISFLGTQIEVYASKAPSNGIAGISLDGAPEVLVDCYSSTRLDNTLIYSSAPLSYESHQLKVRVTGNKNTASQGTYVTADRAVVHTTNPIITNVNDNTLGSGNNQFDFVGSWQYGSQNGAYDSDNHWSDQTGSSYSVNFIGAQVLVFGAQASNNGIAVFSIDNGPQVNVDCYASTRKDQALLYTSPVLSQGAHTLTVKVTGTKNADSSGTYIVADLVSILSYPQSVVPEPDLSYENLNTGLLRYRPISLLDRDWNIEMYFYGYSNYPPAAIEASSAKYKLADTFGDTYFNNLYEWDYTFSFITGNGYPQVPANATEAYQMIENWYYTQLTNQENNKPFWITAVTGHYYYPHYSALWGDGEVDMLMAEVGENVKSTNAHLAFVRGAARQFAKPWGLQFSPWYGGYVLDYTSPSVWGQDGGITYGHSLELAKRTYFLTYMSGGNELHAESASVDWFNGDTLNSDGTFNLSPLGLIGQQFYSFSHSFTDRGIPFTPMAIVLDQYHGFTDTSLTQTFYGMLASNNSQTVGFNYTVGQEMDAQLFNTLWPQSFSQSIWNESQYYLVNSPHGDMYDVLLDNADLSVLRQYPIVYIGGSVNMSSALAAQLQEYADRGGTLILNSSAASNFTPAFVGGSFGSVENITFSNLVWNPSGQSLPYNSTLSVPSFQATTATPLLLGTSTAGTSTLATINAVGNGKVIVTTPANLQDNTVVGFFIDSLVQPLNPFMIQGNIEYLINRNSTGWVLTLINNLGITKAPTTPTVVDNTQAQTVLVTYKETGMIIQSVTEMISNTAISVQNNSKFTVTVMPGDVVILNIPTEEISME